ncbi:MAG TPA: DUF2283 domain-containing protein [Pyrodictiaceae archaeon]|nr:DUF2283 domain-containing protein [Pyrodictiaceae archaeon]HIQ10911.1 DUF2283 domain-containing protein [Pyrodictium sp.]HIQ55744.1 DUF2283 domain-containing protein [Pyrodictium sp.]
MPEEKEKREYRLASIDRIWFEYDKQNDILYINFGLDIEDADEEFLTDDNIVVRIKNGQVVSLTVFEFSKRVNL